MKGAWREEGERVRGEVCQSQTQNVESLKEVCFVCVCLLLQYRLQSCSRGGGGGVEDMCYERLRAEAYVN